MPRIKRITRRQLRKNELFEALQKIILYVKENPKKIKIASAIGGGIILVFLIGNFLIERAINTPREELFQTIFSYHYAQDKERFSTGRPQFISFLSKHKKGRLADIALLYKGVAEMGLKDYGTSSETLKGLIHKKGNLICQAALMNLANMEEEKGDYKNAIEYYKMIKAKDNYLKTYAKERIDKLKKITLIQTPQSTEIGTSSIP